MIRGLGLRLGFAAGFMNGRDASDDNVGHPRVETPDHEMQKAPPNQRSIMAA